MTPLPKPQPTPPRRGYTRVRQDNFIPMTASQRLRWENKRRTARRPIDTDVDAIVARMQAAPYWNDTIRATGEGQGGDDVDNGYLGAVRQAPRLVGLADGQVPLEVARRLYGLGLVEVVRE